MDQEASVKKGIYVTVLLTLLFTFECMDQPFARAKGGVVMNLTSSAFQNGGMIPGKYTCDGVNISPPLAWDAVPEGTKSLALICDDPDAPMGTWVHWVYYDMPQGTAGLPENVAPQEHTANKGMQGINDFRKIGYGGPCPPSGTHRYYFKIYALDTMLNLGPGATKEQLLKKMENHILGQAQLVGKYKR